MKITNIGQAGLLIETKDLTVMVDPYFTDSVGVVEPKKHRRVPMQESLWQVRPDVLIFTHDHLDHHDPETAERILKTHKKITVLCPGSVWQKVRQNGGDHNYVRFDRHTQWTEKGVRFSAVKAAHSDSFAIGVVIKAEGKTLYVTGDTLYNTEIFGDLEACLCADAHTPHQSAALTASPQGEALDWVFLPVNGVGNNMNAYDAARLVKNCGAKMAVPMHVGMFDDLTGDVLEVDNKVVLGTYESMEV